MKKTYVLERYKNEWAAFSLKVNTYDYFSRNKKDVIKWITEKNEKIFKKEG